MSRTTSIELTRLRTNYPEISRFLTEEYRPPSPSNVNELFPQSTAFEEDALLESIHPKWKRSFFALLERPTSSHAAFLVYAVITGLIVTSALITVLETVSVFHSISNRVWFGIETSLVVLFTVEYISRCVAWSYTWTSLIKWIFSFYGIIDLLSVMPYYIELMLQQDTSILFRFSILRMFRLLRVFRPFRYNHTILLTIEVMYLSVRRSQHALLAIGFFVIMILTVFSTLLYFAERGTWDETLETFINSDGDPSQFTSIPAAAWFVLVTITTVGYGEITPRSFLGRLITLPILVCGLLLITLPSFVLGREFSLVWERMTTNKNRGDDADEEEDHAPSPPNDPTRLPYPFPSASPGYNSPVPAGQSNRRDLSNMKLAQNQTELSKQITNLTATVELQGKLLKRIIAILDGESEGGSDYSGKGKQTQLGR
ncbi:voltage-gated potassium channel [Macrolepiota fuliginosa MF-IS2]|uniref:Voltage-gated potassium channel n=1 Tax=Macrolepiota fuliginosa MF-IS2 TaxID=1400762 RepID=A0A9P6BY40_9AGAR|nr:voltage-gated potassium channel [Macrolepiota fuliginosa MF-IS2]